MRYCRLAARSIRLLGSESGLTLLETLAASTLLGLAISLAWTSLALPVRQLEKTRSLAISAGTLRHVDQQLSADFAGVAYPSPLASLALQGTESQLTFFVYDSQCVFGGTATSAQGCSRTRVTYAWRPVYDSPCRFGSAHVCGVLERVSSGAGGAEQETKVSLLEAADLRLAYYDAGNRTWLSHWDPAKVPQMPALVRISVLTPGIEDNPVELVYPIYAGREYTRNGLL